MLKRYIKDIVKTELTKQKLKDIYISERSYNLNSVSDKERQQYNEEISILKNHNNNINERNKYLKLEISQLRRENETLKQDSEETKIRYNKISKENEQLKNLSCTIVVDNDGKLDSLFNQKLKSENEQLKEAIENLEGKLILKGNLLSEQKQQNKQLKENIKWFQNDKYVLLKQISEQKQENEKLRKELRDSKNGLNGANHVIKNNKEWINSQDKKIKELEEEIRCLKSDNEYLQYNLRRKSTQKIQLETKNKGLEEKLTKISNVVSLYNTNDITFMSLMSTIDNIRNILKES